MPPTSRTATAHAAANNLATAYTLSLMSEYSHTLDSLPSDLSRNFADLRELDAVLSTQMTLVTAKINHLTTTIENKESRKEDLLLLLVDIAEEVKSLKAGQEDKIRVACLAADNVKSHSNHLRSLAENIPNLDSAVLIRQTTYPHVASKTFLPATLLEGGRRRRGHQGSLLTASAAEPSPMKRKRMPKDDDGGSPRKERVVEALPKPRNIGRARRIDRVGSPTDSVLSVTSHAPVPIPSQSRGAASSRVNGTANGGTRRARNPLPHPRDPSPYSNGALDPPRREAFNVPPSTSHPSLPMPSSYHGNGHAFDSHHPAAPLSGPGGADWPVPRQLEGPGMPVARNFVEPISNGREPAPPEAEETVEDDKKYCTCFGAGVGDMVGCDQDGCQREWFHVSCLGLEYVPEGKWYCDECTIKRGTSRRGGRGGRRKVTTGRNPRG